MFREDRLTENRIFIDEVLAEINRSLGSLSIDMDSFRDLYGAERVARDIEKVADYEKKFREANRGEVPEIMKLAEAFEGVFVEQSVSGNWFGERASVKKTSRFDDILNGVDAVVEFEEEEHTASHLGLVVDLATGGELSGKIDKIRSEIERGELARIKYFASEKMNFRGELSKVPRVVICADSKTVRSVLELWMSRKNESFRAKLDRHFIQFQILEEIIVQLEAWKRYAQQTRHPQNASVYERALKIARGIYSSKLKLLQDDERETARERDDSFFSLTSFVQGVVGRQKPGSV